MDKKEFDLKKELIKLQEETEEIKHGFKVKELEMQRENDRLHHERELERGRIKSAEIRKSQMRKFTKDPYVV